MLKVPVIILMVFVSVIILISLGFALSACTPTTTHTITSDQSETQTTTQTQNSTQTITPSIPLTATETQNNSENSDPISDQQILEQIHRIIRTMGLDVYPDLDFTAQVENGVVTLEGSVMNYDEDNLLSSIASIDGVVSIICNYEYLTE